jgi:hypothetical protein
MRVREEPNVDPAPLGNIWSSQFRWMASNFLPNSLRSSVNFVLLALCWKFICGRSTFTGGLPRNVCSVGAPIHAPIVTVFYTDTRTYDIHTREDTKRCVSLCWDRICLYRHAVCHQDCPQLLPGVVAVIEALLPGRIGFAHSLIALHVAVARFVPLRAGCVRIQEGFHCLAHLPAQSRPAKTRE